MTKIFSALFLTAAVLFIGACQTAKPRRAPEPPTSARLDSSLVPGDVLRITFAGAADLNQTQKVRPDGRITLPQVGEVVVAGKRADAVQAQLVQLYKSKLTNSDITVAVESSTLQIYVSGAVNRPGKIVLDRPVTVLEAIMEAGGFARGLADPKRVRIIRETNGRHETRVVDLTPAIRGESTTAVNVRRYDVIYVPESWL